jgi:hypothetical protein
VLVLLGCLLIASGVLFEGKTQQAFAGTLYGITGCCPNEFVMIDPSTWALTPLSVVGDGSSPCDYRGAVDATKHRLFIQRLRFSGTNPYHTLIAIDIRTGAVTESPPMDHDFFHLGFDPAVGLIGVTSCRPTNEFVTIDPSTWALTPLSVVGDTCFINSGNNAIDPITHRFFVELSHLRFKSDVVTVFDPYHIFAIDTRTGAAIEMPPLYRDFINLGFDPTIGLLGVSDQPPNQFVTIDPLTWKMEFLSFVGDTSYSFGYANAVDPVMHRFFVQRSQGSGLDYSQYAHHVIAIDARTGAVTESPPFDRGFVDLQFVRGFDDTPPTHWASNEIDAIFTAGITAGFSADPPLFCPDELITRGQMAVFLAASLGYSSGSCRGRFSDVPVGHPFCGFVERLYVDGITDGCNSAVGRNFCPDEPVTRGQMAVFIETALGSFPNVCTGRFADVPVSHPFCGFIERLAADGITGGCGEGNFCPDDPVTRAQMAVFLVVAPEPLKP